MTDSMPTFSHGATAALTSAVAPPPYGRAMATRTTTRRTPGFRCGECGWTTAKWVGRCGECQAWGSVAETGAPAAARPTAASVVTPAQRIGDVDVTRAAARPTGVAEFDRVLGGGLVPGGVV